MISITEPKSLKNALKMIKKISKEAGIIIQDNRLTISALSPSNVALMELSKTFEAETAIFKIEDVGVLEKLLPDTGEVDMEISGNVLKLQIISKRKKGLELKISEYSKINLDYNPKNSFLIPSEVLSEIIEDAGSIGQYLTVSLSPEAILFKAQDEYGSTKYNIDISSDISEQNIMESFESKVMVNYLKVLNDISGDIKIRMDPNRPLLAEFQYNGFDGRLYIAIAGD
ncbi:MAG: hypothetical protein QXD88_00630 [Candidatus Anstonellales archaeon]